VIAWINPLAGLSGDMLLGALLDAGAPLEEVRAAVASTGITGWSIEPQSVQRQGISSVQAGVSVAEGAAERRAGELLDLVGSARPVEVATVARAAVLALAEVEARIHGVALAEVHLHELGGLDTVVDTVGVAAAAHHLGLSELWSGPLRLGHGQTTSAHGLLPIPAPATVALLEGVPIVGVPGGGETVTPTGAALLRALGCRYGEIPAMTLRAAGYGAGTRDPVDRPNVLPLLLGDRPVGGEFTREPLTILETTVDDVTGEVLGHLIEQLLDAGAVDAWITSAVGKKNRPTFVVTALCPPDRDLAISGVLAAETGTLGIRRLIAQRDVLPRREEQIRIAGQPVRFKVGPYRAKPEYTDLAELSRRTGRPIRELADEAQSAWRERSHEHSERDGS
jgi:uncharacterized protein (TIGR00299 family) protein